MTEEKKPVDSKETNEETQERSFFGIIVHSFFIIPFLIAVFCVILFASISLLTRENRTAFDYLEDVKTGGLNKRWQAAFELSKILAHPKHKPDNARFENEMILAFEESIHDDPRVRQYLALAMGRSDNNAYFKPLVENINAEREETLAAVIYALGMLQDERASKYLSPLIEHNSARIRSLASVALGNLNDKTAIPVLKRGLRDPEPNVRWGAAVSLANLGDESGSQIISQMLDRSYWKKFPRVDTNEQTQLILTAIEASKHIPDPKIQAALKKLAERDQSMKIRSAAMKTVSNETHP